MRAVTLRSFDGPSAVDVVDIAEPSLTDGHVLLQMDAAAIGPWDVQTTTGAFTALGGSTTLPQTLGWDVCGTVEGVAPGVTGWRVGDRAFGFSPQPWSGIGVFAERVALPAGLLAPVPSGLNDATAAVLPVVALSADLAVRAAVAGAGVTVLVLGAAGAVGSLVTQLAVAEGATVVASVSASDADEVTRLGSHHVVDRRHDVAADTVALVGQVDAIIDLVGPGAREGALAALRPGGRFVTTVPGPIPSLPIDATSNVIGVQPDPVRLAQLAELVAGGQLTTRVGAILPLKDAAHAFTLAPSAGNAKIVLIP